MPWPPVEKLIDAVDSASDLQAALRDPETFVMERLSAAGKNVVLPALSSVMKPIVEARSLPWEPVEKAIDSLASSLDSDKVLKALRDPDAFVEEQVHTLDELLLPALKLVTQPKVEAYGVPWNKVEARIDEMELDDLRAALKDPAAFARQQIDILGLDWANVQALLDALPGDEERRGLIVLITNNSPSDIEQLVELLLVSNRALLQPSFPSKSQVCFSSQQPARDMTTRTLAMIGILILRPCLRRPIEDLGFEFEHVSSSLAEELSRPEDRGKERDQKKCLGGGKSRRWGAEASGMKWRNAGSEKPSKGEELTNERLAAALQQKTEFTQAEWDAFSITGLHVNHFVKSGESYFQPVDDEYLHEDGPLGPIWERIKRIGEEEIERTRSGQKTSTTLDTLVNQMKNQSKKLQKAHIVNKLKSNFQKARALKGLDFDDDIVPVLDRVSSLRLLRRMAAMSSKPTEASKEAEESWKARAEAMIDRLCVMDTKLALKCIKPLLVDETKTIPLHKQSSSQTPTPSPALSWRQVEETVETTKEVQHLLESRRTWSVGDPRKKLALEEHRTHITAVCKKFRAECTRWVELNKEASASAEEAAEALQSMQSLVSRGPSIKKRPSVVDKLDMPSSSADSEDEPESPASARRSRISFRSSPRCKQRSSGACGSV